MTTAGAADFSGRVAMVTGAGTGIGRATAIAFARAGADVAVVGRRREPLDETLRIISEESTSQSVAVVADVSVPAEAARMVDQVLERFGRLDAAANCAGILGSTESIFDMAAEAFDEVIAVNLRGMWLSVKHEMIAMRAGGGAIVNVSSINAVRGGTLPYAVSKAGVEALTRSAAAEGGRHGIRVNALRSGFIWTPMLDEAHRAGGRLDALKPLATNHTLLGRIGDPDETAAAMTWLCSPKSSYITGTCIEVDGGVMAI